jgi:hypothetical protein
LRPAGSPLQGADDFRRFSICSNHHRESYTSPALAAASYPFVDLLTGNTLRCKLFPSNKFYNRPLYFSETMKYNEVNDKLEFEYYDFMSDYRSPWVFNKILQKP